jgi:hypothetical protein
MIISDVLGINEDDLPIHNRQASTFGDGDFSCHPPYS